MEPFVITRDKKNNHRVMQIDLDVLVKNEEFLEAVCNMIAIEAKKGKVRQSKQTRQLYKESKLPGNYRIELKNPSLRN